VLLSIWRTISPAYRTWNRRAAAARAASQCAGELGQWPSELGRPRPAQVNWAGPLAGPSELGRAAAQKKSPGPRFGPADLGRPVGPAWAWRRASISFFLDVDFSQSPEPDVHLFSAARPSSFGEDVVSCEAGWHGFRKVGCSGSSNSGAYPNLPRDILCLTYGMAEAPSHCPSPHQRIHLSRAYTKARSPTIQK
jgi:hypothetical protein